MAVYRIDEERNYDLAGNHVAGLATRSRHSADVEVWRTRMDAGAATPPHCHDHEEVVVVLSGRGRAQIEGEEISFGAGDTLILPAGRVHQLFSDTDSEAIATMPIGSSITTPEGVPLDLPWRQ